MANLTCTRHGRRSFVFRSPVTNQPIVRHRSGDAACDSKAVTIGSNTLTVADVIGYAERSDFVTVDYSARTAQARTEWNSYPVDEFEFPYTVETDAHGFDMVTRTE